MRAIAAIFIALIAVTITQAQTTITKADIAAYAKPGADILTFETVDGVGAHYNLGDPGAGKTWDFSGLYFFRNGTELTYVEPAATPAGSQFPASNLALAAVSPDGTVHSYLRLADDGIYRLGYTEIVGGTTIVYPVQPDQPLLKFPAAYSDTWTYNGDAVVINGHIYRELRAVNTIDSWGTLKLPIGTYDCIRHKKVHYLTSKVIVDGQIYSQSVRRSVSYDFITHAGITATLVIDSTFETSSVPFLSSLTYTVTGDASPVEPMESAASVALDAVYPNPAITGANASVTWSVASQQHVSMHVYDARGAHAATVYEGAVQPGSYTHPVATGVLAPGMYFIRMTAGGVTETRPFAVIR